MTILYPTPAPVKSRPFGAGILPPRFSSAGLRAAWMNPAAPPARPAGRFEPTAGDRAWWAADDARREDACYDRLAGESAAMDRMESGLFC